MSNDKTYDGVLAYITDHGETGVNVLAKSLGIPLSTMQRYLEKQSYFKKTVSRKWDIPANVNADIKSNTMTLMVNSVENALKLLDSQLTELQLNVQNALMPVSTLKRAVDSIVAPVAGKSDEINTHMLELDKRIKSMQNVFKEYVRVCPEEYQDLIKGLDLYRITTEMGTLFMNGDINTELTELFLEKSTELSEDVVDILKEYQRGA